MDRNIRWVEENYPGVDRNSQFAWMQGYNVIVATREGGVDRNIFSSLQKPSEICRHPRGWRG